MELELLFIIICAAIVIYQAIRVQKLKKEVGNQESLVDAKNDIIENLNGDKKVLKATIDAGVAKRKELEDQVSMLVAQVNQVGLKRGAKGRFVSVD